MMEQISRETHRAASAKTRAEVSAEQFAADLRVSITGAFAAAQFVSPGMRARRSGTLLLTGGGFALEPMSAMAISESARQGYAISLSACIRT